ncbi:hypothetical protein VNO77_43274 [Canavalia gladiata]|uniref:Uncharacterized protein n=1 Tax=Canavalia gladiata TaxID=3824 RepID=A0AAN9JW18_CANGL
MLLTWPPRQKLSLGLQSNGTIDMQHRFRRDIQEDYSIGLVGGDFREDSYAVSARGCGFMIVDIRGLPSEINGFQKLDKIKDANRQSNQLEELTWKMRECKRLIKEFDREVKDEEGRNPQEVNKQLNDEKQSMINELNLCGIEKNKLELFDPGVGASEPTAEENVRMASGFSSLLIVNPHNKDIRDIPGLVPPVPGFVRTGDHFD